MQHQRVKKNRSMTRKKDERNELKMNYNANKIYTLEAVMNDETQLVNWSTHVKNWHSKHSYLA